MKKSKYYNNITPHLKSGWNKKILVTLKKADQPSKYDYAIQPAKI